jgi:hypothetical protein
MINSIPEDPFGLTPEQRKQGLLDAAVDEAVTYASEMAEWLMAGSPVCPSCRRMGHVARRCPMVIEGDAWATVREIEA